MKAIILAAGEGKRLRPLTLNKPKPLLEIRGKSILENTIDYLQKSGIKDIIVLTGYKHQLFDELQKKLNFQQIVFKDYQGVNSAESLKFITKEITKGTFIFNGDLYIQQPFMHYVKKGVSQILAQKILNETPSWGYIVDENQKLLDIDTNALEGYGDGIAFFDNAKEIEFLKKALFECDKEDYWEKCILHSLTKIDYSVTFCESFYIEIDSLKDALRANLITPKEIALQCSDDGKAEKLFSITNTNYKINFLKTCKVLRIPSQGREKIINT
ncbi:MAG: NTP transferase domain-containing protein, partial [Helicobacter sp.]|nr:NTP transferase domain-containing protein [Helicobacter sp.]